MFEVVNDKDIVYDQETQSAGGVIKSEYCLVSGERELPVISGIVRSNAWIRIHLRTRIIADAAD